MKILKGLIACTAFMLIVPGAFAQTIDEDTKCGTVEKIMESPSLDKQRVREVVNYILQTMQAVDRVHALKGKNEILTQMTGEGRSSVALIVTDRCHSHRDLTLADTAVETYEAIRAMRASLALSQPLPKLAQAPIARRRLSAVVPHARRVSRVSERRTERVTDASNWSESDFSANP